MNIPDNFEIYTMHPVKMQKPSKPKQAFQESKKKRKPDYSEQRKQKRGWED